ncbi:MarR family winged helix-turn-helix transcriptional regulator [Micromonospora fluostatini]|uniref:MarR family winged helix-turn-helix transcriptional regulator n=1 Tax=Micromonospora sp. JCM 30529 TaxID=3421643 RepID=UPI003D16EB67
MDLVTLGDVPLERLLMVAAHVTAQRWNRYLAEEHGLTQAGLGALTAIAEHTEVPHRVVAERCFVRPATLTGIIDTLERDGLVVRQRDESDRRSVRLALTDAGREKLATVTAAIATARPLTSADRDPGRGAVVREFLLEVIGTGEHPGHGGRPGHVTEEGARC